MLKNRASGCVIVRIFFRETGMLVHTSSWMKLSSISPKAEEKQTFNNTKKSEYADHCIFVFAVFLLWRRVLAS
jgi:hypothetical protein